MGEDYQVVKGREHHGCGEEYNVLLAEPQLLSGCVRYTSKLVSIPDKLRYPFVFIIYIGRSFDQLKNLI